MTLKAVEDLIGQSESMEQKQIRMILSKGLGREVKAGKTGKSNGIGIVDRNEEDIR